MLPFFTQETLYGAYFFLVSVNHLGRKPQTRKVSETLWVFSPDD